MWPFKWKLLSSTFYFAVQRGPNFWVCGWNPVVWPLERNLFALFGSTFTSCYLLFSILQNKIHKLCYILSRYTGFTIPVYYTFENESIGQLWRRMKTWVHCWPFLHTSIEHCNVGGLRQDLVLLHSLDVFYVHIGDKTRDSWRSNRLLITKAASFFLSMAGCKASNLGVKMVLCSHLRSPKCNCVVFSLFRLVRCHVETWSKRWVTIPRSEQTGTRRLLIDT